MTNINAVLSEYNSGVSIYSLIDKYNLSGDDLSKLKELNAKIAEELGVNEEEQPLPGSTELVLDDGTTILARKIREVNQPKGGTVSLYLDQNGKKYYQYVDENGTQQKVSEAWDYLEATCDNIEVAWKKMMDGHPIDAAMVLMEGAESPDMLTTGIAPIVGLDKGAWIFKFKDLFSKLKNVKNFEQFKAVVMSLMQDSKAVAAVNGTKGASNAAAGAEKTFTAANGKVYKVAPKKGAGAAKTSAKSASASEGRVIEAGGMEIRIDQGLKLQDMPKKWSQVQVYSEGSSSIVNIKPLESGVVASSGKRIVIVREGQKEVLNGLTIEIKNGKLFTTQPKIEGAMEVPYVPRQEFGV